jgi:hypothetical protein
MAKAIIYLRATEIEQAVRDLFRNNGCVVLSQVRNGTGYARTARTADMMVVSTWPSRGLYVEGVEIKSNRSDLMRELGNPKKADDLARYCQRWWIAVPDGLTDGLMMPPTWGVITVNDKLKAKVERQGSLLKPEAMDALLVCSILRNFSEGYIPLSEVQPKIEAAVKEANRQSDTLRSSRLKELEAAVHVFRENSGIDLLNEHGLTVWNVSQMGKAVKLILNLKGKPLEEIARAQDALRTGLACIDAALGVMDQQL